MTLLNHLQNELYTAKKKQKQNFNDNKHFFKLVESMLNINKRFFVGMKIPFPFFSGSIKRDGTRDVSQVKYLM